jgi:hypothetical protein
MPAFSGTSLVGLRFGHLEAIGTCFNAARRTTEIVCRCDCGRQYIAGPYQLRTGGTRSCGCQLRLDAISAAVRVHGHVRNRKPSPTYRSWQSMWKRCTKPDEDSYQYYGAAGITVCERWRSFENFLADMGERPVGTSIDRKDNALGYKPANCRWATVLEQARNKRGLTWVEFRGERHTISEWTEKMRLPKYLLSLRLRRGWSVERALTTHPSRAALTLIERR